MLVAFAYAVPDRAARSRTALAKHWQGELVERDVSGDGEAYWRFLDRVWRDAAAAAHDLAVVEHDIVVHEQVFTQFAACPQPWCSFAYQLPVRVAPALGCVRFRHQLLAARPDTWDEISEMQPPFQGSRRHWSCLDWKLAVALSRAGYQQHRHDPPVTHLHRYPG